MANKIDWAQIHAQVLEARKKGTHTEKFLKSKKITLSRYHYNIKRLKGSRAHANKIGAFVEFAPTGQGIVIDLPGGARATVHTSAELKIVLEAIK